PDVRRGRWISPSVDPNDLYRIGDPLAASSSGLWSEARSRKGPVSRQDLPGAGPGGDPGSHVTTFTPEVLGDFSRLAGVDTDPHLWRESVSMSVVGKPTLDRYAVVAINPPPRDAGGPQRSLPGASA